MNRRLAKSQLSKPLGDASGSTAAEFALLALPLSLLLAASINYCLNVYLDSVFRYQVVATARFGALADVTLAEANLLAEQRCQSNISWLASSCSIAFGAPAPEAPNGYVVSTFSYQPLALAWFQTRRVVIHASVANEVAK